MKVTCVDCGYVQTWYRLGGLLVRWSTGDQIRDRQAFDDYKDACCIRALERHLRRIP